MELLTKKIYAGHSIGTILKDVEATGNYKNLHIISAKLPELKVIEQAYRETLRESRSRSAEKDIESPFEEDAVDSIEFSTLERKYLDLLRKDKMFDLPSEIKKLEKLRKKK